MSINVLIVDDSPFLRKAIASLLDHPDFRIIGTAEDGQEAIAQASLLKPDVILMDIEMPVMDGISAVRVIMRENPRPILMFSSLTESGAQATLDSLAAGAVDFLPKRLSDLVADRAGQARLLQERVRALAGARLGTPVVARPSARLQRTNPPSLIMIGASTGGPGVLGPLLQALPRLPVPLVVVQHMPAGFTEAFARQANKPQRPAVELHDGYAMSPGTVHVAPGGLQVRIVRQSGVLMARIQPAPADLIYKPNVDVAFSSAAEAAGRGVLGIVLTGMGADGREGARAIKAVGGCVWTQQAESCVIYGMPRAVDEAGLSDRQVSPDELSQLLVACWPKE